MDAGNWKAPRGKGKFDIYWSRMNAKSCWEICPQLPFVLPLSSLHRVRTLRMFSIFLILHLSATYLKVALDCLTFWCRYRLWPLRKGTVVYPKEYPESELVELLAIWISDRRDLSLCILVMITTWGETAVKYSSEPGPLDPLRLAFPQNNVVAHSVATTAASAAHVLRGGVSANE